MDRRDLLRAAAALVVVGSLPGCVGGDKTMALERLRLGGGEPGSTFSKLARALGRELRAEDVVPAVTIVPSDGSRGNLDLLARGDVVIAPALTVVTRTADADLVALARLYEPALQCLVRDTSSIRDIRELAGRPVAIGPAGSDSATTAQLVLEAIGVTPAVRPALRRESAGDRAIALAGGAVDAMFWWGGRPSPEIRAVAAIASFRPLDLGDLPQTYPMLAGDGLRVTQLPDDFYGTQGTTTLGSSCLLLARRDTNAELVETIVRTLVERGSQMVPQPANGLQYFTPASLFDTAPFDLHPAAAATYRDLHG